MPGTSLEPPGTSGIPWARPWDPRGRPWDHRSRPWDHPGTPLGPPETPMDNKNGLISANVQRQKLLIAVFKPAFWTHRLKHAPGLFSLKRPPKSKQVLPTPRTSGRRIEPRPDPCGVPICIYKDKVHMYPRSQPNSNWQYALNYHSASRENRTEKQRDGGREGGTVD